MRLGPLIEGNDTVLKHVASEREKNALVMVSPMAREAIKKEILPQLEESITSVNAIDELAEQTKDAIEVGFQQKSPVYTRLIGYKSIDQSDTQFLQDLLHVMDEWGRKTKETLSQGGKDGPEEVKVKVQVDTEVKVQTEGEDDNVSVDVKLPQNVTLEDQGDDIQESDIQLKETHDEPDVAINEAVDLLFDLGLFRM